MRGDVQTFVRFGIHCPSTVGGEKVPEPFSPALHGTMVNDLLQFYFIGIAPSSTGEKHM